ncbi:MAG TPA: phospho-N-acetylmuramoyl-pentapeptide-transferase [Chloroflexi bacterium]|nr:phospho-N-acetylmuramoyl-pentapeptide-transferase [Chloroflexota bacterium]
MLPWLGEWLTPVFGPFRLLTSYLFLASTGTALAALATWLLLPRLWSHLPRDGGRAFAVDGERSRGKPVGAGLIFVSIFAIVCLLVLPFRLCNLQVLACMLLAMAVGFIDDKIGGLSELQLGLADLGIAFLGALAFCEAAPVMIWLPLIKTTFAISPWLFVPLATLLIWLCINATNCTDGVDGLSGSLATLGFVYLGGILYAILGHQEISHYLLVPHYPDGANWAIMAFVMAGCLAGYLWHNAHPSAVLMGDAGSRPMGFLIGLLVLATGNPFMVVVVAFMVLVDGATGLLKVALLRFFNIGIFRTVRYPLHDHVRKELGWSNTQVLVRFVLLQTVITPLLLVFLFKVR